MKIVAWLFTSLFVIIIGLDIYISGQDEFGFYGNPIVTPLFLIFLLLYRNKLSWLVLLITCAYGIYDEMWGGRYASSPTIMDITGYIDHSFLFKGRLNSPLSYMVRLFPLIFYLFTFIILWFPFFKKAYFLKKG